jgi:hypothetical protein
MLAMYTLTSPTSSLEHVTAVGSTQTPKGICKSKRIAVARKKKKTWFK